MPRLQKESMKSPISFGAQGEVQRGQHGPLEVQVQDALGVLDRAAGEWFAREGFVEEALGHLINAGAIDAAADVLGANVRAVLDADMTWQVLQRWLSLFPAGAEHGHAGCHEKGGIGHGGISKGKGWRPRTRASQRD